VAITTGGSVWARGFTNGDLPRPHGHLPSPSGTVVVARGSSGSSNRRLRSTRHPGRAPFFVGLSTRAGNHLWKLFARLWKLALRVLQSPWIASITCSSTGTLPGPGHFGTGPCAAAYGRLAGDAFVLKLDGTSGTALSKSLGATGPTTERSRQRENRQGNRRRPVDQTSSFVTAISVQRHAKHSARAAPS